MRFSFTFRFALTLILISALTPLQSCKRTVENAAEADGDEQNCGVQSAIPDGSTSPWTDSSLAGIKRDWVALNARPPSRSETKGDEFKLYALEDVFQMSLSKRDLKKLASTCGGLPVNPGERDEFTTQLVAHLVVSFVHSGDRENLVKVLSSACPDRAWGRTPIEFFVAAYGSGRLSDPITVFADAYATSNSKEVRHVIASAVRRAFFTTGIRSKDDAELIKRNMQWYKENRVDLAINEKYRKNDDDIPLETYEAFNPNPFDMSPTEMRFKPLFTKMQPKITSEQHVAEPIKLPVNRRSHDKTTATTGRQIKEEMDLLQGKWKAVGLTSFGKQLPKDRFEGLQVVINGGLFQEIDKRDSPEEDTMSICVEVEPHAMNLRTSPYSDAKWQWTELAIYKLEGDHLKICFSHPFGGPRPLDFRSVPHWCEEVMDLERVK